MGIKISNNVGVLCIEKVEFKYPRIAENVLRGLT